MRRPGFRMPLTPYSGYATLVFLVGVLVLMAFDAPIGTWTIGTIVVLVPMLIGGWYLVRGRVLSVARERMGYTGEFPVVANRPVDPDDR
jgi:L-asparagine permease